MEKKYSLEENTKSHLGRTKETKLNRPDSSECQNGLCLMDFTASSSHTSFDGHDSKAETSHARYKTEQRAGGVRNQKSWRIKIADLCKYTETAIGQRQADTVFWLYFLDLALALALALER